MPGAELTEVVDDKTYKGRIAVRLGPVALTFAGTVTFEELDNAGRRAAWRARIDHPAWRAQPNPGHLALVALERGQLNDMVEVSIDSRRQAVMEAALAAGARMINDVSALRHDPRSLEVEVDGQDATLQIRVAYTLAAIGHRDSQTFTLQSV